MAMPDSYAPTKTIFLLNAATRISLSGSRHLKIDLNVDEAVDRYFAIEKALCFQHLTSVPPIAAGNPEIARMGCLPFLMPADQFKDWHRLEISSAGADEQAGGCNP
jgi:hypothetical protein